MNILFLTKGLLLGLGLALPIGPIGLLCFRYNIMCGRTAGLVAGLGAATADLFYASLAAFGIAFIMNPLIQYQGIFKILSGIFLICFGIYLYLLDAPNQDSIRRRSPLINYFSTFFLTLSNPMTLAMFAAFFAILGLHDASNPLETCMLVISVFIGSCLGWVNLTLITHLFKGYITLDTLHKINKMASICILIFGIFTILSTLI